MQRARRLSNQMSLESESQLPSSSAWSRSYHTIPMPTSPCASATDRWADFSVVESFAKVADWTLQIVQHAKDGKYYVVRQISGSSPVYRQIFWNGKKQYFGQILPIGNYTIILRAKDVVEISSFVGIIQYKEYCSIQAFEQ